MIRTVKKWYFRLAGLSLMVSAIYCLGTGPNVFSTNWTPFHCCLGLAVWSGSSVLCGQLAFNKGRDVLEGLALGLMGFLGIIIEVVLPAGSLRAVTAIEPSFEAAQSVRFLGPAATVHQQESKSVKRDKPKQMSLGVVCLIIVLGLGIIVAMQVAANSLSTSASTVPSQAASTGPFYMLGDYPDKASDVVLLQQLRDREPEGSYRRVTAERLLTHMTGSNTRSAWKDLDKSEMEVLKYLFREDKERSADDEEIDYELGGVIQRQRMQIAGLLASY